MKNGSGRGKTTHAQVAAFMRVTAKHSIKIISRVRQPGTESGNDTENDQSKALVSVRDYICADSVIL